MKDTTRQLIEAMREGNNANARAMSLIRNQEDQITQLRQMLDIACSVVELHTSNGAQTTIPEQYLDKDGNVNMQQVASYGRVVIRMTETVS